MFEVKGPSRMIVFGTDVHKDTHTAAAVNAGSGEVLADWTVPARRAGFERLLACARRVAADGQRVWAIEDCRHVSGGLERWLIKRGERVVRVPPRLMAGARAGGRERGKSDRIDAVAVARAAIREGVDRLPMARLDGPELEIRLLADHRERLVGQRTRLINDLRWQLHDLWPDFELPQRALRSGCWQDRIARRLQRAAPGARIRVARDELRRIRDLTRTIDDLETELAVLVAQVAPQLLTEPGCGALTAAKLVGEIAGIDRFNTDAQLARLAGVAPIPVSSGRRDRHRLDRGGNRQLNSALHRWAIARARVHGQTNDYLARRQAAGNTRREALRALKRILARRLFALLRTPAPATNNAPSMTIS
jgi:transposase